MSDEIKIMLEEKDIPTAWYNIQADLPNPLSPPLNPASKQPISPSDLQAIFPMDLIAQEVSRDRWIDIPGEVLDIYRLWRPTPLFRAKRLEKALQTPAEIYYKNEGVSPAGSHKPNTAIAQAYYNKKAGIKQTDHGDRGRPVGQRPGLACRFFGMECTVFMVQGQLRTEALPPLDDAGLGRRGVAQPQPGRPMPAARCWPSTRTRPGSLGIAISEAVEDGGAAPGHQLLPGQRAEPCAAAPDRHRPGGQDADGQGRCLSRRGDRLRMAAAATSAGIAFPFLAGQDQGRQLRAVAVEPRACPTLTRGAFRYDFGDTAGHAPMVEMYTLGHDFMPPGIHAGGLRYHGASPLVSRLLLDGMIEAQAYGQTEVFKSAVLFAQSEGILPAPEAAHAIHSAVVEALAARDAGKKRVILFNLSGHGYFDMTAYDDYLHHRLDDVVFTDELLGESLKSVPSVG